MLHFIKYLNGRRWAAQMGKWFGYAALHAAGTMTIFVGIWWFMLPPAIRSSLTEAYHYGLYAGQPTELYFHLGLSACFWAMLYIGFQLLITPSEKKQPRLVKARGLVYLEFIVVLPVFLLLNLGLIQLTILNTAHLLTNLASFKTARAVALWHPEAMGDRNGVTEALVGEKALVAAASTLAPVAPADFAFNNNSCSSDTLEHALSAFESLGHAGSGTGGESGIAKSVATFFDTANFQSRGQRKLMFAHCATEIGYSVNESDHTIEAVVSYHQQMAMPWANQVFGSFQTVAGRDGHYATIVRAHTVTYQVVPFADIPD